MRCNSSFMHARITKDIEKSIRESIVSNVEAGLKECKPKPVPCEEVKPLPEPKVKGLNSFDVQDIIEKEARKA